ncbi:MAG TPA: TonB-dependent receptor [Rhizomicrobium sp.]|jgi:outer membrane receptor protein involved in Fe transport
MTRYFKTMLLGSISLLALGAPALAAATSDSIEQVVVTATKRAEKIKDVPMAITFVGQDKLDRLNARSFEDYVANVPGLALIEESPTHPQIALRGINAGGDGATVGTYLDETPYGSSSALANAVNTAPNLDTFDMNHVEVLRGPQGTLYGSSTLGGLLKFVTNAPDPSGFASQFEVGGTSLDGGGSGGFARAMVNVPISDDSAIRLVGFDSHDAGWIDDPGRDLKNINGVTSIGGRASLLFHVGNKVAVRLNASTQKIDANGDNVEDVTVSPGGKIIPLYGTYEQQRTASDTSSARYSVYNATVDWDLNFATLTSASSYGAYDADLFGDDTGALGADVAAQLQVNKATQEVRLASNPGGSLDWLVGGYYTHEIASLLQNIVFAPHTPAVEFLELDSTYVEKAAFADVTYHFSPAFDLSVGGRYAQNDQHANEFGLAAANGASSGDVFTWSVAGNYHLDDETTFYARVAKGYRPGGPNVLPIGGAPGAPTFYNADSLINYEAGVKSDLLDGKLSLDADVFYIDWTGIQLITVIASTGVDINGGSARSEGVEWDAQYNPLEDLTLSWSGAYTNAQLTSDTPALVGGKSGDALPWAPKWASTVDAEYRFATGSDFTPYVGASWKFVGQRESDFQSGSSQLKLPSYNAFEARLGLDWNNWELELYGKNLSNAKGYTEFSASGTSAASGNAATAGLIAPRLMGLVLRAKF